MREIIPYKDFPKEIAILIYRWLLELSKDKAKGKINAAIKAYDKKHNTDLFYLWKEHANTIRSDDYYYVLLKSVLSYRIKGCNWCKFYLKNKCRAAKCKFNFSVIKTSNAFEIDVDELRFILEFITEKDKDGLEEIIDKVNILYTSAEEKLGHKKIYVAIYKDLEKKGHINKKVSKWKNVLSLYGVMPDDIKQILYSKIWNIIRRYDYLPIEDLTLKVAYSLEKELINEVRKSTATERYMNYSSNSVPTENEDGVSIWEEIPSDEDPEILYIDQERRILSEKVKELSKDFDVIEDMWCSVICGEPNEVFIDHLKKIKKLKKSSSWESFYNNTSVEDIKHSLNLYFGCEVDKIIRQKVENSINNKEGGLMSDKIKISIPKTKCILCGYWLPTFWTKKERIPKDCSPAFPGCPVHVFDVVCEFPVHAAALQLRKFIDAGDDDKVQEFMATAPNPSDIFKAAMKLTPEEIEAALAEEEAEDEIDIEGMGRVEMLNFIIKCGFAIPGLEKMSDEELKETLMEMYEESQEDDSDSLIGDVDEDEDNGDDEEDDVRVIQTIESMSKK